MATKIEKTPMDSGYSWVILLACVLQYMVIIGTIKSSGIIYTEMLDYFDSGAGITAWTGSLNIMFMHLLGPLVAVLVELLTFRWVSFIGASMCVVAYVLSAFAVDIKIMYLTYGVINGVGYAFLFTPALTISSFYFTKYRALASGIITAGSGAASFIFPYLYRMLLDNYMLHGALMIIGAIFSHLFVTALILRQPMQLVKQKRIRMTHSSFTLTNSKGSDDDKPQIDKSSSNKPSCHKENENTNEDRTFDNVCGRCKIIDLSVLKNPSFVIYTITVLLHTTSFVTTVTTVLPAHMDVEFSKQEVATAMSVVGVSEFFSRLFFGWFLDRKIIKTKHVLFFTLIVSGTGAVIIPMFKQYEAYLVYASIVGAFASAYVGLLPVLLIECCGLQKLPKTFGLLLSVCSIGLTIGQPTAGWIADFTGSWQQSFRFVGGCSFLASLVLLFEPLIVRICNTGKTPTDIIEINIPV